MAGSLMGSGKRNRYFLVVRSRLGRLLRQPVFWLITAVGNGIIVLAALAFHAAESETNPGIGGFIDSFYWAISTVTTVGYGSLVPTTPWGKGVGILLMMFGSLFVWSYMALFVGAVVSPDLNHLEREIKELESDLNQIQALTQKRKG